MRSNLHQPLLFTLTLASPGLLLAACGETSHEGKQGAHDRDGGTGGSVVDGGGSGGTSGGGSGGTSTGGSPGCEGFACRSGQVRFGSGCTHGWTTCYPELSGVECVPSGPCPLLDDAAAPPDPCLGVDTQTDPANCGACGAACSPTALVSPGGYTMATVVRDGIVYFNGFEDAVLAVPRGGGPVTTLAPSQEGAGVSDLVVDAASVYFAWFDFDAEAGAIKKVPRGGGPVTTLATTANAMPWRLAIDASNVYWTEGGGGVKKVPLDGGAVATVAERPGPILSFAKPPIAVDGSNLYFVEMSADGTRGVALRQMPLAGGPAATLVEAAVLGLAVDAANVYFVADSEGKTDLGKVPIGGGAVTTLWRDASIGVPVVSGDTIYFAHTTRVFNATGFFEGYVMKVRNDGTGLGRITGLQHGVPEALSVAEGAVFWSSQYDHTLFSLALDACSDSLCR